MTNVGLFYSVSHPAIVPDLLLSLEVTLPEELWEKKHRSYFIWEYGKPPDGIIEIVSDDDEELGRKKDLYARLGMPTTSSMIPRDS